MSRIVFAAIAAGALLQAPLAGQERLPERSTAELQAFLARLDSTAAETRRMVEASRDPFQDSLAAAQRAGRVIRSGGVAILAPEALSTVGVRAVAETTDSLLTAFPVIPDAFVRAHVLIIAGTEDPRRAIQGASLASARHLNAEWGYWHDDAPRHTLSPLAEAYRLSLDTLWRAWLPLGLGIAWDEMEAARAIDAIAAPDWQVGNKCLEGDPRGCRTWLGLDRAENPFAERYSVEERRDHVRLYRAGAPDEFRDCIGGNDDACLRIVSTGSAALPQLPAPEVWRAALLRAIHAHYGAEALQRAVADTAGSLAERISRATGVPIDTVMLRARTWVLAGGQRERVRAGATEMGATAGFGLLLLLLATRSGRWR